MQVLVLIYIYILISIMYKGRVSCGSVGRVLGLIVQGLWVRSPLMPTVSCGITSLGKMLTWPVPLSTQEKYGYPALRDTGFCALYGSNM